MCHVGLYKMALTISDMKNGWNHTAARAAQRLSSPARTAAATMRANFCALVPGTVGCGPRTPSMSNMAAWGSRIVPPPIVPTSIDGIVTEMCKSPSAL